MFISFEGPEGCGKSTHAKLLVKYLADRGKKVLLTLEPGGTLLGKKLRALLLDPAGQLEKTTEIFLFAADRSEHVQKIIQPALKEGSIVISDRYIDSTLAYQLGGRALPEDQVRYFNMVSGGGLLPDLTILLDVSSEIGLARARSAHEIDRFEQEKIAFHQRVRQKYLELAAHESGRIKVIRTDDQNILEVQKKIQAIVDEALHAKQ
ncbi:dTMP kinase [Candidatus Saganbacteria bacterium]|nr:dTMP kinase [Candidatus Saganbacteria bacterium]